MTTHDLYVRSPQDDTWSVEMAGDARFSFEYNDGRERLLSLYQKGKDKQWDAASRIDWDLDIDPDNPLGIYEPEFLPIFEAQTYQRIKDDKAEMRRLRTHLAGWQISQFLHGEQGAMVTSARIVESVPDMDAKFYAATQTMDEARHCEAFSRLLHDKIGVVYPINPNLQLLLQQTLSDSRWDMAYLGMQVLIEGLALAAFGTLRDLAQQPLPKQVLAYVMQDEARHVAFGRLALRDAYRDLTSAERADREEFVVEACYLMRDRFRQQEVWEQLGYDVDDCLDAVDNSEGGKLFRNLLFTRIVPCIKDIGLWGEKVQRAYADMGVLEYADVDLDAVMAKDEDMAIDLDQDKQLSVRIDEVDKVIALGAS